MIRRRILLIFLLFMMSMPCYTQPSGIGVAGLLEGIARLIVKKRERSNYYHPIKTKVKRTPSKPLLDTADSTKTLPVNSPLVLQIPDSLKVGPPPPKNQQLD